MSALILIGTERDGSMADHANEKWTKYLCADWINDHENIRIIKDITTQNEGLHDHEFIEIEYIYSGAGVQHINGISHQVERGDLMFLNIGDSHRYEPNGEMGLINCILTPEFVHHELVNSQNALDLLTLSAFRDFTSSVHSITPIIHLAGKNLLDIESLFESMGEEFNRKEPGYLTVLNGYLNVLLARIFRLLKGEDTINAYSEMGKVAPAVLKYIEENYNKKLSLKELAGLSFFNPSYFSKVFKDCFGKNVTTYINEKRFEAAAALLRDSDQTVEAISLAVGYKDKKQLYKLFRDFVHTTPEKYRKQIQTQATAFEK